MTPAALAAILFIGAAPVSPAPEALIPTQSEAIMLEGTEWEVFELGGRMLIADPLPVVSFLEDGGFSATAGCNRFTGSANIDGDTIAFPQQVAGTMMACPEPTAGLEQDLIERLTASTGLVRAEGGLLTLVNEARVPMMRLRPVE